MSHTKVKCFARSIAGFLVLFLVAATATAQDVPPNLLQAMQWRLVGPHRGGRITSVSGVPRQPAIYYIGTPGGGVWKTENGGQVWKPIFDQEPVASIGALVVAPSNPRVVYVGTGEQTQGNGVYKSIDAGLTWTNIGLRQTHVITGIVVDPRNAGIVLVAAAGDHWSGAERGIYKTTDGGKNWQKVLYQDAETGVADVEADPDNPSVVYTAVWTRPDDPFSTDEPEKKKKQDGAIYKSTDEGSTWNPVEGKALPADPMGRVGVAIAPGTHGMRVYAICAQGLFRSEDGGATWQRSTTDPRILGNGYFSRVFIDPKNADFVYVAQTSMYRSIDGGRTFAAWAGAPSGDDFHVLWINPANTQNMILGVDQGAIVSVDGGNSWSSWYNQATGQFYHVSTDQHFPYYVYAAQQDSGTVAVPSRSDYGEITYRDWAPTGGFEFCYIAPDPLNPNYVYAGGWYGTVLRYDKTTGQIVHLLTRSSKYRTAQMAPLAFSPQDPHTLYAAAQYVLKSTDGGFTWQEVSPDLTQKAEIEKEKKKPDPRRAVINTIALSTVKAGVIWAGTGNGLIQVTKDGKTWRNVTIPGLHEKASITAVEASRHDAATAYVVVSGFRDLRPLIYRTRDYGQSWQLINTGLPETGNARVVREDPSRKGLLYAGTWNSIYFSLDDGDHWQALQLNLPTTMVTDLDVHDTDLVASTFGRSLWILDDITPLRQFDAKWPQSDAHLLSPRSVVRVRWDMSQDTPLPPETPAGDNPPDGATIYYFLKSAPAGDIKLSIYDSHKNLVREFTNVPAPYDKTPANAPEYWFAPQPALTKTAGLNRFAWDLRYPAMKALRYGYYGSQLDYIEYTLSDHAVPGDFPRELQPGAFVVPGEYSLVLEVNGKTYPQSLSVTLDPRVQTSQADLVRQFEVESNVSAQMAVTYDGDTQARALRAAIADRQKSVGTDPAKKDVADALKTLDDQVADAGDGKPEELGLGPLNRELARRAFMIESGDARPAALLEASVEQYCQELGKRLPRWRDLNQQKIAPVNTLLQKQNLAPLPVAAEIPATPKCEK